MKTFIRLLIVLLFSIWAPSFGTTLNMTAKALNNNKMPVWCITQDVCDFTGDDEHQSLTAQTRLVAITDIIPLVKFDPVGLYGLESIGDMFIFVGFTLYPIVLVVLFWYLLFRLVLGIMKLFRPGW